jgi:predicted acyl esterase
MGTNEWRHAPSLDKTKNATLRLYLSDTRSGDKYSLSDKRPNKAVLTQQVDLKDRQNQNNYFTPNIIFESLDASNGLVFETQKFEKDFLLTGSFSGNLFATINKRDMDVSMAMYELLPDGKYFFLTRYVGRASYAKDDSRRQLLTPGRKESIPFSNTRFVSRKISTGSRLVILLNINKHPFEIINYGSGKEVADETISDAGEPLKISWHGDSYIQIPIWKN